MSSVDTAQDQAVLWTLDFDAELPCESAHLALGNHECSGKAVAHQTSCGVNWVICAKQLEYAKRAISSHRNCAGCKNLVRECWSIRPI